MDVSELFRIGDVARMFHLSVGSLRHYEQAGLLKPEYIDPDTGYRYYSTRQFEVLNTIRYLRVLDMPLGQIADFLQNKDIDVIEEKLLRQKETVVQKQKELRSIEQKIDYRLQQLRDAKASEFDVIRVEQLPACRIAWIRDSLRPQSYFDLEESIRRLENGQKVPVVFLGKVGVGISKEELIARHFDQYDRVFIALDDVDDFEGEVEYLPQGECVSVRFCGSHREAPAYYGWLETYIREHGLKIAGSSREITMIDYGITNDTSKFVTEIRIPVEKQEDVR